MTKICNLCRIWGILLIEWEARVVLNMSQSPHSRRQISQRLTQAVQKLQAGVSFNHNYLKKGAKVPELRITNEETGEKEIYPLLGDRYVLGRSSRSCDIVVTNPVVSQTHCSLHRDTENPQSFILQDEKSTNGVFCKKRRLNKPLSLKHGDILTLAPPELAKGVSIEYYNPPPLWAILWRYSLYGSGGILGLLGLWMLWEWTKIPIYPLPGTASNPVVIYAGDGKTPLNPVEPDTHQEIERLSDFSPYLPKAVIASEDSRYYWHFGVDPYGVARAVFTNLQGKGIRQGASTLTQQLARSLFTQVGRENTAGRKLREMIVAFKIEAFYSKDEILRYYLNRVYLGGGNYGFEDAAQFYFEKSARNLSISEAATLVAMLPAPNLYNPVQDYQTSVQFRDRVITRMASLGMISQEEAQRARRSRIEVSPKATKALSQALAPYFYSYIFGELQDLLGEELAKEGNFIVETSLDINKQKTAEQALKTEVGSRGKQYGFSQGAMVTLDTRNGEILALVGGTNYQKSQFNRASQAKRQPGSTFKVFDYGAAIEKGISPSKTYSCESLVWQGQGYKACERSHGAINMYQGLAQSENAIALRVAQDTGLDSIVALAERLGIKSPLKMVPGMVLGESEVNVLEITGAYATFANLGIWNRPHGIRRILDGGDCGDNSKYETCRVIYNFSDDLEAHKRAISPELAQTLTTLMQGAVQSGTAKAAFLGLGEAGKTGTTNNAVDLWFIGYVPSRDIVTGIWLGNDDNSPTRGSSKQAAVLWKNYMGQILR